MVKSAEHYGSYLALATVLSLICGIAILALCYVVMLRSENVSLVLGLCYGSLLAAELAAGGLVALFIRQIHRATAERALETVNLETNDASAPHTTSAQKTPHRMSLLPVWGPALLLIVIWQWILNPVPLCPAITFEQYYAVLPSVLGWLAGLCAFWVSPWRILHRK